MKKLLSLILASFALGALSVSAFEAELPETPDEASGGKTAAVLSEDTVGGMKKLDPSKGYLLYFNDYEGTEYINADIVSGTPYYGGEYVASQSDKANPITAGNGSATVHGLYANANSPYRFIRFNIGDSSHTVQRKGRYTFDCDVLADATIKAQHAASNYAVNDDGIIQKYMSLSATEWKHYNATLDLTYFKRIAFGPYINSPYSATWMYVDNTAVYLFPDDDVFFADADGDVVKTMTAEEGYITFPTAEEIGVDTKGFAGWTNGKTNYEAGEVIDIADCGRQTYTAYYYNENLNYLDPVKGYLLYYNDYDTPVYVGGLVSGTPYYGGEYVANHEDVANPLTAGNDSSKVHRFTANANSPYRFVRFNIGDASHRVEFAGRYTFECDILLDSTLKSLHAASQYAVNDGGIANKYMDMSATEWKHYETSYDLTYFQRLAFGPYINSPYSATNMYVDNTAVYLFPDDDVFFADADGEVVYTTTALDGYVTFPTASEADVTAEDFAGWMNGTAIYEPGAVVAVSECGRRTFTAYYDNRHLTYLDPSKGYLLYYNDYDNPVYINTDFVSGTPYYGGEYVANHTDADNPLKVANDSDRVHSFYANANAAYRFVRFNIGDADHIVNVAGRYTFDCDILLDSTLKSLHAASLYAVNDGGIASKYMSLSATTWSHYNMTYDLTYFQRLAFGPQISSPYSGTHMYVDNTVVYLFPDDEAFFTDADGKVIYTAKAADGFIAFPTAADAGIDADDFAGWKYGTKYYAPGAVVAVSDCGRKTFSPYFESVETIPAIEYSGSKNGLRFKAVATGDQYEIADEYGFVCSRKVILAAIDGIEDSGFDAYDDFSKLSLDLLDPTAFGYPASTVLCSVGTSFKRGKTDIIYELDDANGDVTFAAVAINIPADKSNDVIVARPYMKINGLNVYGAIVSGSLAEAKGE